MGLRRIVVIGGGPAGLLVARLLRRRWRCEVTVYERQPPGSTYGFGVAVHHRALVELETADPEVSRSLVGAGHPLRRWTLRRAGHQVGIDDDGGLGIGRAALLERLTALALRAGVDVRIGRELTLEDVPTADLVVAADGVGSAARRRLAGELGVHLDPVAIPYVWCGAALDTGGMLLATAETGDGIFTAHVMPYAAGRATFQVDTEPAALERSGMATPPASTAPEDPTFLEYLERAFADVLAGVRLEANRTRWSTFTTVACERWWHGRTVLVGDAVHTAHYTVGSGTRMAMEDAIALAAALDGGGSLEDCFAGYETARRPAVERLQRRARRSQRWWASLRSRFALPLPTLLLSYFTRTGSVRLADLVRSNRALLEDCLRHDGQPADGLDIGDRVLARPFRLGGRTLPSRVIPRGPAGAPGPRVAYLPAAGVEAWSEGAGAICARAAALRREGAEVVCLTGPAGREELVERLDLAEQVRSRTGLAVAVQAAGGQRDDVAVGLLAHRIDLVAQDPGEAA